MKPLFSVGFPMVYLMVPPFMVKSGDSGGFHRLLQGLFEGLDPGRLLREKIRRLWAVSTQRGFSSQITRYQKNMTLVCIYIYMYTQIYIDIHIYP